MKIRALLHANPLLTCVLVLCIAGTAVGLGIRSTMTVAPDTSRAFFTIDDGKTWFVDSSSRIPPFEKDGKTAYRCSVYECDGKRYVVEIQKYDDKTAKALHDALTAAKEAKAADPQAKPRLPNANLGLLVKAPGETTWHSVNDHAAIMKMSAAVKCGSGYATAVAP